MCETAPSSWAVLVTSAEKNLFSSISLSPGLEPMEEMKISQMSTLTEFVFLKSDLL